MRGWAMDPASDRGKARVTAATQARDTLHLRLYGGRAVMCGAQLLIENRNREHRKPSGVKGDFAGDLTRIGVRVVDCGRSADGMSDDVLRRWYFGGREQRVEVGRFLG